MKSIQSLPLLAGGLALWAGCASVPPAGGFAEVEQQVNERARHRVVWRLDAEADARADAAMQTLLQTNLTARTAVQVALLNNRHLQATYEELGVAQAALVQAGLLKNPVFDTGVRFPNGGGTAELELGVAQDFLDVFYLPLRRRVAEEEFAAAKLRVTRAVLATAADGLYEVPAGLTFPGIFGAIATAHMDRYDTNLDHLLKVAIKNHENGALNPKAQFNVTIQSLMERRMTRAQERGQPVPEYVTEMDFLNDPAANPWIAWPLRLYDCAPITDGAA